MNPVVLKNLKSLTIASIGAGLTYALAGVSGMDFGVYTPLVVAAASVMTNVVKTLVESSK